MNTEELIAKIERFASDLGEHADAVQILVTFPADGGGTRCIKRGAGNWYARIGMARELLNGDQAEDQANLIAEKLNPPDEGDLWKTT